ncbi:MAG: alpha/beta fold hydrolase [Oligoflexia bacterium]|nr:alpha/beta fold hydrolase [Oligoflexia bacterium]
MKKYKTLSGAILIATISLVFSSSYSYALPEKGVAGQILEILSESGKIPSGTFLGKNKVTLTYMKFGETMGPKGSIVVSPGNGESSIRYTELAVDLFEQGYSPIYVIDHRGQGFSGRLLPDSHKSHVESFSFYADDLKTFIDTVVMPQIEQQRLYIVAHSMGGAIAADFLERYPSKKIQAAVFLSPMMMIYDDEGRTESELLSKLKLGCFLGRCNDYIPGAGPYQPKDFSEDNRSTSSKDRFAIKDTLRKVYPQIQLGGTTLRWVKESINAIIKIRSEADKIKTPVLLMQASEDKVVDNRGQDEFCEKSDNCRLVKIEGAKHGLHLERDQLRNQVIDQILKFFN